MFQPNTFQLVLIYDPGQWHMSVMFLYEKTGWDRYWMVRDSLIGFCVTEKDQQQHRALAQSGKSSAFEMADVIGNTSKAILFTFRYKISQYIRYIYVCVFIEYILKLYSICFK